MRRTQWTLPCLLVFAPPLTGGSWLNGNYILQPALSDSVPNAVDSAVAGLNGIIRPFARRRLGHTNQPARVIRLQLNADSFEVQFDTRAPIRTLIDGRAIPWTREDGERFMVHTKLEASRFIQRFEAPDGAKTYDYQLDPSRLLLSVHVTVQSPKLTTPLNYTLVYRRQGS